MSSRWSPLRPSRSLSPNMPASLAPPLNREESCRCYVAGLLTNDRAQCQAEFEAWLAATPDLRELYPGLVQRSGRIGARVSRTPARCSRRPSSMTGGRLRTRRREPASVAFRSGPFSHGLAQGGDSPSDSCQPARR